MQSVNLSDIRTDGGTQMRANLSDETVAEYADIIRNTPVGEAIPFPAVTLFFDGSTHWLADGFHRFFAFKQAGAAEINAEVHQGTKRDAILHSVGANSSHGIRRTNADKRKAVETLLADKEWASWPQAKIAAACGVSREFVNRLSQDLSCDRSQDATRTIERGGKTYQQNTENIGKSQAEKDAEREARREQIEAAERQRADNLSQLPPDVRERMSAAEAAIADRAAAKGETVGAPPEDRIAELEAKVESLELELSEKTQRIAVLAHLEELETLFELEGVDGLLAAKDRVIESKDAMLRSQGESLEAWKKECLGLRKRLNVEQPATSTVIDMQSGEVRHAVR